jgi:hypothetical protein
MFTGKIIADGYSNNQNNNARQKELDKPVPLTGSEINAITLPSAETQISTTLTSAPYININSTEVSSPIVTTTVTNSQTPPKPPSTGTTIPITSTPQGTLTTWSTQTPMTTSTPTTTPTVLPTNTLRPTNTPRPSNTPRPTHTPRPTKTPK